MRVALLQFPLLEPRLEALRANVPLAAGYLKSYAEAAGLGARCHIEIAPRSLADAAGDAAILQWLSAGDFEVLGLTFFLWNAERSLRIAAELKQRRPDVFVVAGGPEIADDAPWLRDQSVDCFVIGEGEAAFVRILETLSEGGRPERIIDAPILPNLASVPNPYLSGTLSPAPGDAWHLETMRGCPCRCTYCHYGKTYPSIRRFPDERIADFFALARERGAGEIYVMDPSFNAAGMEERLRLINQANSSLIPLHTELALEALTPELADALRAAGFVSVEAGLQSTNAASLRAVKRPFHRGRFLQGARLLLERGILIRTGLILGLPEETLKSFAGTLDFVVDAGLGEATEIYPLALLPGTPLRDEASVRGMDFMDKPPYWVLSTPALSREDFFGALDLMNEKLGVSCFERPLPHGPDALAPSLSFLDGRTESGRRAFDEVLDHPDLVANALTIILPGDAGPDAPQLRKLAESLRKRNPSTLVQLVLRAHAPLPDERAVALAELFLTPELADSSLERSHWFDPDPQGRFGVRIFQLTEEPDAILSLNEAESFADPILRYPEGGLDRLRAFLAAERPLLWIEDPVEDAERRELEAIYEGQEESLIFI